jgi:hypothetical protein
VSGTYTDTIFRQTKCDSVITVEVTIDKLSDVSVVRVDNETIEASETGDSYRWLSCEGYVAITGETSKTFAPKNEDQYAVEVRQGECIDTSDCYVFVGLNEQALNITFDVYPNPAHDKIFIEINEPLQSHSIKLFDLSGRLVKEISSEKATTEISVQNLQKGVYIIEMKSESTINRKAITID